MKVLYHMNNRHIISVRDEDKIFFNHVIYKLNCSEEKQISMFINYVNSKPLIISMKHMNESLCSSKAHIHE